MAHGAPDHVRMSDINLLDYTDKYFRDGHYALGAGEHWEFVNEDKVGCLGLIYFKGESAFTFLKVTIDGVMLFYEYASRIFLNHQTVGHSLSDHCGVTEFDEVNDRYCLWANFHYQISFKRKLQVELYNTAGVIKDIHNLNCYWKERG